MVKRYGAAGAQQARGKRVRRANNWLREAPRILVITLFVACMILGIWGFTILRQTQQFRDDWGGSWLNIIYFTIQLFLGDSGPVSFGEAQMYNLPWQLNVARLLAPAATVIGALIAFLVLFDEHIKRTITRNQRGHVVVVGETPDAEVITEALRNERVPVVQAASGSKTDLIAAGTRGASAVYICNDDSNDPGANLRVAATVKEIPAKISGRTIAVALLDPNLAPALLARHVTQPEPFFDLFSLTNSAASRLAAVATHGDAKRIWLLGSGRFRDEVLYELVQEWQARHTGNFEINVFGEGGEEAIDRVAARLPESMLSNVTMKYVEDISTAEPADITIICGKDDAETLGIALSTPETWQGKPGSLLVHVARGDQADALFGPEGVGMLDSNGHVLNVVPTASLLADVNNGILVHESTANRLDYVAHRTHNRLGYGNPAETEFAHAPAVVAPTGLRHSLASRLGRGGPMTAPSALHPLIGALEHSGWKVVPFAASVGLELPPGAIDWLAECYYNDQAGLSAASAGAGVGAGRVQFSQLPPEQAKRYRDLVASLPETLAQMGLGVAQIDQGHFAPLISSATPPVKRGHHKHPANRHQDESVGREPADEEPVGRVPADRQVYRDHEDPTQITKATPQVTKATPQVTKATPQVTKATPKASETEV